MEDPRRPKRRSVHPLELGHTDSEKAEMWRVFLDLPYETDRGLVILSFTYLEEILGRIISAYLVESREFHQNIKGRVVKGGGPFSTFQARKVAAFTMGLISEDELIEFGVYQSIRNEFAHNFEASFDDSKIMELCNNIQSNALEVHNGFLRANNVSQKPRDARTKFQVCMQHLLMGIYDRPKEVQTRRLSPLYWKSIIHL